MEEAWESCYENDFYVSLCSNCKCKILTLLESSIMIPTEGVCNHSQFHGSGHSFSSIESPSLRAKCKNGYNRKFGFGIILLKLTNDSRRELIRWIRDRECVER